MDAHTQRVERCQIAVSHRDRAASFNPSSLNPRSFMTHAYKQFKLKPGTSFYKMISLPPFTDHLLQLFSISFIINSISFSPLFTFSKSSSLSFFFGERLQALTWPRLLCKAGSGFKSCPGARNGEPF